MHRTGIAAIVVVVSLATAAIAHPDDRPRRGRRGYDGRVAVRPRVVVRPPVVHHYGVPRRAVPFGRLAYRPVHRPGLGLGIYIGSPYRYGRSYYSPRYYSPGYSYGYAPFASAAPYPYAPYAYPSHAAIHAIPPSGALYGGVRLDVTPREAQVFVDGYYAGIVDDFDGMMQRVALEPGPHRFEVVAQGYETLTFDVNVRSDQTVHYRGDMRPC